MQFATQQEDNRNTDTAWGRYVLYVPYRLPVYHNGRIDFECVIGWHLHKIDDM